MANPVSLHCPLCGQKLKIKNRALFGKKVKCPGCSQSFVLHDPNSPPPSSSSTPDTPPQIQIPENENPSKEISFPDFSQLDTSSQAAKAPPTSSASDPLSFLARQEADAGPSPMIPSPAPEAPVFPPVTDEAPAAAPVVPVPAGSSPELDRFRRRRKSNGWAVWGTIGGVVVLAGLMIGYFITRPAPQPETVQVTKVIGVPQPGPVNVSENEPYSRALLETHPDLVAEFEPTSGQPIELYMMPSGVSLVIHLRPADLFSESYEHRVLRASLTDDVMSWLSEQIKALTRRDPSEIEDLTIGVIFGARGMAPQFSSVVRLAKPEKLSSLIELFPGEYLYEITERPDLRIKVDDQHGYLIHDEQTYAICPASMASELEYSIKVPNQDVSAGMEQMLKLSDKERLITVMGNLRDLQIHLKSLFPEAAQPFMQAVIDWLGEDVETVSWSVHPDPYLHSEVQLRPVSTKNPMRLETEINQRLDALPEKVWKDLCIKMHPREMRFRKLIGRLPAMLEAFQESTISSRGNRQVTLTTVLPAKATPNLVLATLFTINEAARTNFAAEAVAVVEPTKPRLPETVAERMKTVIVDSEFNRTPLEPALTYLCNEIEVNLHVDGDALKDAGYTKNMPQTFNLGKVPMQRALFEIINAYQEKGKEMVISVDEKTKTITVLTRKFAEQKGLPIFPLKPE